MEHQGTATSGTEDQSLGKSCLYVQNSPSELGVSFPFGVVATC